MLGDLMRRWARRRYQREASETLEHLRSLDDPSIGLVLAICVHQRNAMLSDGVDFRNLTAFAKGQPMYHYEMSKAVRALMRSQRPHDALGLKIWIHSLRAALDPALRAGTSDIWRELARGHEHIARARELVRDETGFELDIRHASDVPTEFRASE